VEVRKAQTCNPVDADPDNSFYVRIPGTRLKEGLLPKYRFSSLIQKPAIGKQYELMLGMTPFSFTALSDEQGTHYRISYGGETYLYPLGLPAAATLIRAVADLDAGRPGRGGEQGAGPEQGQLGQGACVMGLRGLRGGHRSLLHRVLR
jgi:hypothetical protein